MSRLPLVIYCIMNEMTNLNETRTMTDRLQDWQKRATDTCRTLGTATNKYVHENTWTTIALSAIVGCIVGYFLASRGED